GNSTTEKMVCNLTRQSCNGKSVESKTPGVRGENDEWRWGNMQQEKCYLVSVMVKETQQIPGVHNDEHETTEGICFYAN
ncbi:MAG: hypothetical protein AAF391_11080, partial [Bacteroidota bacterium]